MDCTFDSPNQEEDIKRSASSLYKRKNPNSYEPNSYEELIENYDYYSGLEDL